MHSLFFDKSNKLRSGWRAGIFLFAFIFASLVIGMVAEVAISKANIDAKHGGGLFLFINGVVSLVPALLLGWLCGKFLEKLPFEALGASFSKGWLKHLVLGALVGLTTLGFAVLIAFAFGGERFYVNPEINTGAVIKSLAVSFVVFAVAAAFEEALFRGYILQTFARSGLAWVAILLTSVFFGFVHLGNPNVSALAAANTVIAGVWFSIAYLKTRDLWFVFGIHLMWNWMQGSFFGIEVSGLTDITTAPFLKEIDTGPTWLTGTNYGLEGGIACTAAIIISMAAIHFIPLSKENNHLGT